MTEQEELQMWKKMYMRLLRGVEESINVLVQTEQECEELYIRADHTHQEYSQAVGEVSKIKRRFCRILGEENSCTGVLSSPLAPMPKTPPGNSPQGSFSVKYCSLYSIFQRQRLTAC